jgi:hypothetical protein
MTKMKRLRLMGVALLAVFALGAVAASAAQAEEAPSWVVNGARLGAGQTRFITAKEVNAVVLSGDGVKIDCTTVELLPGAAILGSAAGESGANGETVTLKSCSVEGNGSGSECSKITEPINTKNLKSELVLDAKTKTKLLVLFQPAVGATLAELKFPKGCKIESSKVAGSLVTEVLTDPAEKPVELPIKTEQAKSWLLKLPATQPVDVWLIKGGIGKEVEIKQFEFDGIEATLSGTVSISLESGEEWAIGEARGFTVTSGPIEFPKGISLREITLTNTGNVAVTFKNGVVGAPGEISVDNANFALHEISANKCGEKLPGGDSCAVSVSSAKEGEKGEYELEWSDGTGTNTTTRELN